MRSGTTGPNAARQRGFTMTELFAVVAVAAVLAAIAVPNLSEFIKNNARSTRLNAMVTALNYARTDAVTQRRQTRVCPSLDNATCTGTQYEQFILVMSRPTAADPWTLLRTFESDGSGNYTLTGSASEVIFLPTGLASGAVANTTFVHCDDRGAGEARAVVLSATGHPSISEDTDANGIDDVNGVDLACP